MVSHIKLWDVASSVQTPQSFFGGFTLKVVQSIEKTLVEAIKRRRSEKTEKTSQMQSTLFASSQSRVSNSINKINN